MTKLTLLWVISREASWAQRFGLKQEANTDYSQREQRLSIEHKTEMQNDKINQAKKKKRTLKEEQKIDKTWQTQWVKWTAAKTDSIPHTHTHTDKAPDSGFFFRLFLGGEANTEKNIPNLHILA